MENGFKFLPHKWLSDQKVLAMDWDCRAMHLHLICIAWQNEPQGTIPDNDQLIVKWLNINLNDDYHQRIKKQIFNAWIKDKENNLWIQKGIRKNIKQTENINPGFKLENLKNLPISKTILEEDPNPNDQITIWQLGLKMLQDDGYELLKARNYLGKLIKNYSEKSVAQAISEISLKKIKPANVASYLNAVAKQKANMENGKGKGGVVL